jgi:HlyD family secretion protein
VAPGMRPGMSSNIVITTGTFPNSLWVPSQALFESDGRSFVYLETPSGFVPHDVKLVRRSESQVVLTGIQENQVVALASPDQQHQANTPDKGSAMKALAR